MEKKLGTISILISYPEIIPKVSYLLSEISQLILAPQGLSLREHNLNFIFLIIEGRIDAISSLIGKIGKLKHIQVNQY